MSPFHLKSSGSDRLLCLRGDVTVEHARDLHAALVAELSADSTLHLDAREVSRLDAAVVQVLLAAARAVTHVEIVGASPAWSEAFRRFGLSESALTPPLAL